ncbi:hypothetical protein BDM02DRAFT_3193802, partial [Thelephora ganbajun]
RHKPYERPLRSLTIQSGNQEVPPTSQDGPPRKQVDGAALSRLFQQLAPLTKDPSNFESNAAAICASFDLDPTTSAEIISSFKQQLPVDKTQGSNPPVTSGPTANALTSISVPVKHQRPFTSGPKGYTVWYATALGQPISSPPASLPATAGILYIHTDLSTDTKQVWLCNINCNWADITNTENVKHPSITDRILLLRSDGIPSWLTGANYAVVQSWRDRSGR